MPQEPSIGEIPADDRSHNPALCQRCHLVDWPKTHPNLQENANMTLILLFHGNFWSFQIMMPGNATNRNSTDTSIMAPVNSLVCSSRQRCLRRVLVSVLASPEHTHLSCGCEALHPTIETSGAESVQSPTWQQLIRLAVRRQPCPPVPIIS